MAQQYTYQDEMEDVDLHPGYAMQHQHTQYNDHQPPPRKDSVTATVHQAPTRKALPPLPQPEVAARPQAPYTEIRQWTSQQSRPSYNTMAQYGENEHELWYEADREEEEYGTQRLSHSRQVPYQRTTGAYQERRHREQDQEQMYVRQSYNNTTNDPRSSYRSSEFYDPRYTSPADSAFQPRSSSYRASIMSTTSDYGRYPGASAISDERLQSMTSQNAQKQPRRTVRRRRPSTSSDSFTSDE